MMKRFEDREGWRAGLDDQALADLSDEDGRDLFSRGEPVTLERYLEAVPDLAQREVPLDAAIEAALRSMSGSSVARRDAAEGLAESYPHLRANILDAYVLSRVIATTNTTREALGPAVRALPCEFGPKISDDRSRFLLKEILGEGSFGQVYLADDRVLSDEEHVDEVAIKIAWSAESEGGVTSGESTRAEAARVRRIKHPNVARLHDRGATPEGEEYLVFEHVEGGTLSDWAASMERPVDRRAVARMMASICRGVHAAHANGVIHHDLKPANVLIDAEGQAKVTDFGISITSPTRAEADRPRGNLAFAAPEQVLGELGDVSTATDIYSLGAMMFWLMTGALPHGSRKEAIDRWHRQAAEARRASLASGLRAMDRDLVAICLRAMSARQEDRYASAAAMAEDLETWLAGGVLGWTRPSVVRRVSKWARRRPVASLSLAVVVLALVFGAVMANLAWIASARFESYNQARREAGERIMAMKHQVRPGEFEMQALTSLWLLDSMNKESIFGDASKGEFIWKERVRIGRRALAEAPPDSLESLLWETQVALWLVQSADEKNEAPAMIAEATRTADRLLTPEDRFHDDLEVLRLVAAIKQNLNGNPGEPLETLVATLDEQIARLEEQRPGSAFDRLAQYWRDQAAESGRMAKR